MSSLSVLSSERREVHRTEHGVNHRQSIRCSIRFVHYVYCVWTIRVLMYFCGVQIARREYQKVCSSIHELKPPPTDTIGITVVVQSETMLGSRS